MSMLVGPPAVLPPQNYPRTQIAGTRPDPEPKDGDQSFPNHSALHDVH